MITIEGNINENVTLQSPTDNITEAIRLFKVNHPNATIESINGKVAIGFDEATSEPIFEEDDYVSDEEGTMFLTKNL